MRARAQLLEAAANFVGSQSDVTSQFRAAVASNMTVVRMFGHGVATGFHLQDPAAPGTYSERAFQAFDYVLDQAARFGLKLVISLANNWDTDSNSDNKCAAPRRFRHRSQLAVSAWGVVNTPPVECPGRRPPRARGLPAGRGVAREADAAPGGRFAYTGGEANQDAFYTSASARKAYMAHVRTVLSRVNTINNKARPRSCALHVSGATRPASQSQRTRPARTCGAHAACVRSGAGPPAPPTRRPARPRGKCVARPTRAAPARRRHTVTTTRFCPGT